MAREQKSTLSRWPMIATVSVVAVIGILGVGTITRSSDSNRSGDQDSVFSVRRGPLTISVVESGTIQARERVIIKNEVEGQSTIIYLIPEGTVVEKGKLLVELEESRLQDDLVEQQIRVQNAEAAFIRARENLEVVKNQTKSDISRAELDHTFAQEDLKQYVDGQYPQQLKESASRITLAREELERADEKLKWSGRLYEEKYISQTELEADRLTYNRANLDHELAVASKQLLEDYTHQRELAQLQSDIEQAGMALERVRLKSGADIVQAEADLKAKEAEFRQQQAKLEKVERQIANTRIYAPRAGLVVYATSARASWRGNDDPLEEGQSVRERQELIYQPTADEMVAELQIHESNLDRIRIGMPVRVTIDALKGRAYTGRVTKIAPLPNAFQMRLNPDLKVYVTEVLLDGKHHDVRTGMSCQAEIIVDQYEEALYVPVQAVVREGDQPVAYVRNGDSVERTPVQIGLDNNRMVRIVEGLREGQDVLLTPPLAVSLAVEGEQTVTLTEGDKEVPKAGAQPEDPSTEAQARTAPSRDGQGPDTSIGMGSDARGEQEVRRGERGGDMSAEGREAMQRRFQNMSAEDREAMRRRFENMSAEEREAMRQRRRQSQPQNTPPDGG